MKTEVLEIYSEASNHAVVRVPGRRFPGVVVQGDSLSVLHSEAKQISQRLAELSVNDEEILYLAQGLQQQLLGLLLHYQETLSENKIELPYSQLAKPSDLVVIVPEEEDAP